MGVFTGDGNQHLKIAQGDENMKAGTGEKIDGYPTDVPDLKADDLIKIGKEEYPAFNVTPEEFWSNQQADRKRIRFKKESKAGYYMRHTRNGARPFYIKTTANDGKTYTRKIR